MKQIELTKEAEAKLTTLIEYQEKWTECILWDANKGRICDYCRINIDIPWHDILIFFHEDCWKQYRKDGKPYPLPKYA